MNEEPIHACASRSEAKVTQHNNATFTFILTGVSGIDKYTVPRYEEAYEYTPSGYQFDTAIQLYTGVPPTPAFLAGLGYRTLIVFLYTNQ